MKKATTFATLNVTVNYNSAMLRNTDDTTKVSNVVTYLVRTAELEDAKNKVEDISKKLGENLGNTEVLSKEESELWEEYKTHKATLEKLVSNTGYTEEMWKAETEEDKIFFQLIAIPNLPRKFAKADLITPEAWGKYMELAEKYFASATSKVDAMKNQLEHDFQSLRKGGSVFRGVRIRPSATDTKKLLALFVKDIKQDEQGNYDFATLWANKKKTEAVKVLINKFLAMYIVNRMEAVSPLTDKEEGELRQETATPDKKLSEKTVARIKKTREKKANKKQEETATTPEETATPEAPETK